MNTPPAKRLFNVGLRGFTLLVKFALLFSLARFLEPTGVGLYGLLLASVTYAVGVAGFGFCKFANREVAGAEPDARTTLLRDQLVFHALAYLIAGPLAAGLFVFDILPWTLAPWFALILLLEHAGTEADRVLVAVNEQLVATLSLFLRNAAWVLALIPLMWARPDARTLEAVLGAWAIGGLMSVVVAGSALARVGHWDFARPVDWAWLRRGARIAAPLLVASLALKGLTTFDRFWVKDVAGLEVLGAYVLFAGIAVVLKVFLDSGVFVFSYPALIRAVKVGDERAFRRGMRELFGYTAGVMAVVVAVSLMLIRPVLAWIDRPLYDGHLDLYYWSLAAVVLYAFGMVAHYGIYAHHRDRTIVTSQLAGLAVFFAAGALTVPAYGAVGVPVAMCAAYTAILVHKSVVLARVWP